MALVMIRLVGSPDFEPEADLEPCRAFESLLGIVKVGVP